MKSELNLTHLLWNVNTTTIYPRSSQTPTDAPIGSSFDYSSTWGPRRDPLYIVVPITIVYALIFFTGVIGNVSTCIVIARNKSMHTATNYYLFSLAVSDLLLLVVGLPPEMHYIWSKYPYLFGEAFCILQGFAAETSANATVLTITAFTVERYMAICHPFWSHTMSKLSRAVKFVVAIWILALCLAVPQAMAFGLMREVVHGKAIEDHCVCVPMREIIPHAFEISTFVFFMAPMSLITVLYVLIGLQLRRSKVITRNAAGSSVRLKHNIFKKRLSTKTVVVVDHNLSHRNQNGGALGDMPCPIGDPESETGRKNFPRNAQTKATRHVVKMLVAVVACFFICWAPFHAQRLLAIYSHHSSPHMVVVYTILTYISGVLYYLSTAVNPLLYNIMSNKFRNAFKDTLARYLGRRCHPRGSRCYSNLSIRSTSQNTSHSQSGSQSCQTSLRYLEADMLTRRPLVVSFRRRPDPSALNHQPECPLRPPDCDCRRRKHGFCQCQTPAPAASQMLENDLQVVFDRLVTTRKKRRPKRRRDVYLNNIALRCGYVKEPGKPSQSVSVLVAPVSVNTNYHRRARSHEFTIPMMDLSPCRDGRIPFTNLTENKKPPPDNKTIASSNNVKRSSFQVEDIEIFHEQQLRVRSYRGKSEIILPSHSKLRSADSDDGIHIANMPKSFTLPFVLDCPVSIPNFRQPIGLSRPIGLCIRDNNNEVFPETRLTCSCLTITPKSKFAPQFCNVESLLLSQNKSISCSGLASAQITHPLLVRD